MVQREGAAICARLFLGAAADFVRRAVDSVAGCFAGQHPHSQVIDLRYHDLEHTMAGTLCLARLLEGRARAGAESAVSRSWFELGYWPCCCTTRAT
jgi:hypothetical protein